MATKYKTFYDYLKDFEPYQKTDTHVQNVLNRSHPQYYGTATWRNNQNAINAAQSALDNREKFSYDFNKDAVYQQYKDNYIRQGRTAMADAAAQAAALSGGFGNSYAASVGNQAYQSYLSKLNNVIPELESAAYARYQAEGNELNDALNRALARNELDRQDFSDRYSYWQDDLSRAEAERDRMYSLAADQWNAMQAKSSGGSGGSSGGSSQTTSTVTNPDGESNETNSSDNTKLDRILDNLSSQYDKDLWNMDRTRARKNLEKNVLTLVNQRILTQAQANDIVEYYRSL